MTREQMLETALRNAKVIVADYKGFTRERLAEIDAALATPPTSEWNEAIEAACSACEEAIEALKRKEQP